MKVRKRNRPDGFENGPSTSKKPKSERRERCGSCKQETQDLVFYNGHLNGSCEEFVALTNDTLSLFTGNEENVDETDSLPIHKITSFCVYDNKGHLCRLDSGLIEKNVVLYLSGYIKPIYDEDPSYNNGIAAHDVGPINEWYVAGFDGGVKPLIGIVTSVANYILMEPSSEYVSFFQDLHKKASMTKLIVEFLLDHAWEDPTYEDLLFHLQSYENNKFSEDFLLQHAQFICDHIYNFDEAGDDEKPLITIPCVRSLVAMSGVTFRKRKKIRQLETQDGKPKKANFTKATTTVLVRSIFENFFTDQIEIKDMKGPKKRRCGVCDACQSSDCGKCSNCKDMVKFGGNGKSKQACSQRKCPNMAVQDAEESENEAEVEDVNETTKKKKNLGRHSANKVKWVGEPVMETKGRQFYDAAIVGGISIRRGDYVMLNPEVQGDPLCIAKVQYMYNKLLQGPILHAQLFCRGTNTILGETADPQELFVVEICEDCPLGSIVRKAEVAFRKLPENWSELGGTQTLPQRLDDDHMFFYNKKYESVSARFIDYFEEPEEKENLDSCCSYCQIKTMKKKFNTPTLEGTTVKWRGDIYKVGTAVFLDPLAYTYKGAFTEHEEITEAKKVNETMYPEYYRKTLDVKGSNLDTPSPFCISQIESIAEKSKTINITVRIFYRPENTRGGVFVAHLKDLNLVYWTSEVITTSFENVAGKCHLLYCDIRENPKEWCEKGPYRFYFTEAYDTATCKHSEVPAHARISGNAGKGKGKRIKSVKMEPEVLSDWGQIERPLRCMDVFAGCGGLSKGLHQAGIADTEWAIEKEAAAALAYKLNNQTCKVFTDDCNHVLQQIMSGEGVTKGLPTKGEVELLVGGPPCQGFSGMNRFNAGQYSLFKNSLVVAYLSYCEYFRPKYFVLENVRNFVSFKRSMVLKLTLRCLLAMGYQVGFGVLQAGHYGIPQTRRRLILIAAAPGYVLPKLPEPQNVFNRRCCHLSLALDGVRYTNGNLWTESAPYRTICVRDAISDLPEIKNGWNQTEMPHEDEPVSHFQRKMRRHDSEVVVDHVCKEMAPIIEARISYIPAAPGSDWRDLPNISIKLSDGTTASKLVYSYRLKRQNKNEPPKGVCQCATGLNCDPADRQLNTLIPWCLPHTGDRHNHWAGLYGRLEWDGFFGTTITNPEPMGKQGRVLHPQEHRVVSVRECARSQGFPDDFKFHGSIMDKYRQVGNAVPPPLGEAIGLEIRKALAARKF